MAHVEAHDHAALHARDRGQDKRRLALVLALSALYLGAELAGGLSFEGLDRSNVPAHAEVWEKVVRKLRGGLMPPPGGPRPGAGEIAELVTFLETSIDSAAATPAPGHVPLHRLNRKEYANAIRDLLALEIDAASLLPQDDKNAGFDNIAGALQVSPSFIEQYVLAARLVAVKAMGRADARPGGWTFRADSGQQLTHVWLDE